MASPEEFDEGMIRPSLIQDLQRILDQYPDDGQILRELIQNAEDAGAREVKFMLDESHYDDSEPNQFCNPDLSIFQGPALYAYNNEVFADLDWKGLRTVFDSIKAKDPMKVGRFGLGFKSVFHMTDMPSVLSGEGLGFLDPQERYLETEQQLGKRWKMQKTSSRKLKLLHLKDRWPQQLQPYIQPCFGSSESTLDDGHYQGTLFRFPLRNEQMDSYLSDTIYTPEKILTLFESLESDGSLVLLFLRNIERIQLLHKKGRNKDPEAIFEISLAQHCMRTVREERNIIVRMIEAQQSFARVYSVSNETAYPGEEHHQKNFMVCQHYKGVKEDNGDDASVCYKTGNLPWVGVAAPWEEHDVLEANPKGHVFCFLPLPKKKKVPTATLR